MTNKQCTNCPGRTDHDTSECPARPWESGGLPNVGSVVLLADGRDVSIKAHTHVAGRPAAIWQSYDEFGYVKPGEFSIDPESSTCKPAGEKLGADGLEVVATCKVVTNDEPGALFKQFGVFDCHAAVADGEKLCRLTDAQRLLSQLREELAQRDAEIERMRSHIRTDNSETLANALARIAELESQQAASVGGGEFGDAYQGAREDMAIWKRRALEAEAKVREQDQIIENLGNALNAENGPTFMGEPALQVAASVGGELDRSAERNAMQRQRDQYEKLLERECADVDSVLGRLGFTPDDFRTDGGFLKVDSIVAALSPAGGGVVMPERADSANDNGEVYSWSDVYNKALDDVARLNAKPHTAESHNGICVQDGGACGTGGLCDVCPYLPQANSQEGSK